MRDKVIHDYFGVNLENDSRRSSTFCVPMGMSREIARSTFQYAGPTAMLRVRLPSVPGAGCAKAARLK